MRGWDIGGLGVIVGERIVDIVGDGGCEVVVGEIEEWGEGMVRGEDVD